MDPMHRMMETNLDAKAGIHSLPAALPAPYKKSKAPVQRFEVDELRLIAEALTCNGVPANLETLGDGQQLFHAIEGAILLHALDDKWDVDLEDFSPKLRTLSGDAARRLVFGIHAIRQRGVVALRTQLPRLMEEINAIVAAEEGTTLAGATEDLHRRPPARTATPDAAIRAGVLPETSEKTAPLGAR